MPPLRILGSIVSEQDFKTLKESLCRNKKDEVLFTDNELTRDDVSLLIDHDENNQIEMNDLCSLQERLGANRFGPVKNILKKYGFNIYKEVPADNLKEFVEATGLLDDKNIPPEQTAAKFENMTKNANLILNDPDFLITTIQTYSDEGRNSSSATLLDHLSDKIKNRSDIFERLVNIYPIALKFASDELKANESLVIKAVQKNGEALQFASEDLKNNPTIAEMALKSNPNASYYVGKKLANDPDFIKKHPEVVRNDFTAPVKDPQLALFLVQKDGLYLRKCDPSFLDNENYVSMALQTWPYAILEASDRLQHDPKFIIKNFDLLATYFDELPEEIRLNPEIAELEKKYLAQNEAINPEILENSVSEPSLTDELLAGVRKPIKSDEDLGELMALLGECIENKLTFVFNGDQRCYNIDQSVLKNREIVKLLVQIDNNLLNDERMPTQFRTDPELIEWATHKEISNKANVSPGFAPFIDTLKENPGNFYKLPAELQNNFQFCCEALANGVDEKFLEYVPSTPESPLGIKLQFAVAALKKRNPHYFTVASQNLDSVPNMMANLVYENIHLLQFIDSKMQETIWPAVQALIHKDNPALDPHYYASPTALKEAPYKLTYDVQRIRSIRTLGTLLVNQNKPDLSDKPCALVFFPKADWNGALHQFPLTDKLVDSGQFNVLYYEVSSIDEMKKITSEVKARHAHIEKIILSGHGTPDSLQLANPDPEQDSDKAEDEAYIDFKDIEKGDLDFLTNAIEQGGQMFLYSCSNGSGGQKEWNNANALSGRLDSSVTLLAFRNPANIKDIKIDKNRKIEWVTFGGNLTITMRGRHPNRSKQGLDIE